MLCIDIMRQQNAISVEEWNYFLRGAGGMDKERPPKPQFEWMLEEVRKNHPVICWWQFCSFLVLAFLINCSKAILVNYIHPGFYANKMDFVDLNAHKLNI